MFIENKYKTWHDNIINKARHLNRDRNNGYYESHHIVPKSCGGDNSKSNLVLLTAREHFIIHQLLTKFTEGQARVKMLYAFSFMVNIRKSESPLTSKQFSSIRKAVGALISERQRGENNHRFGKKTSEGTKAKLREASMGNSISSVARKKISVAHKGKTVSQETRDKISKANTGRVRSEVSKESTSKSLLGEKNYRFKGYYHTPLGRFSSTTDKNLPVREAEYLTKYCKSNHITVTPQSYRRNPFLASLDKSIIGKTYKEAGFWFEEVY
jgi:hypothetical protein